MLRYCLVLATIFTLLLSTIMVQSQELNLREQVESYRDAVIARAKLATDAKKEWMAKPTPESQAKFNHLADEAKRLQSHLESMESAVRQAEAANSFWRTAISTSMNSITDMGGYISSASTYLFGATNEELYGPNWETINTQYAGMHTKFQDIIQRKKAAMAKPDNEAEVTAILAEIDVMKKKYEILRQMIRLEQRNIGVLNTFWGEDGVGRHVKAVTENLDVAGALVDGFWCNPKIIYTVFKPAIMLQLGQKYITPKGNLTPQIADSIVIEVMGIGPTRAMSQERVDNQISNIEEDLGDMAIQALLKKAREMAANKGAEHFARVQNSVMREVRQQMERELEVVVSDIMRRIPYEQIPTGNTAQFGTLMEEYLARGATRTHLLTVAQETMEGNIRNIANVKRSAYIRNAMKSTKSGALSANSGPLMDATLEAINLYATIPATTIALEAGNMEAAFIRSRYKDLVKAKAIDPYEQTEDEYLNSVWGTKWKTSSAEAKKAMADAADKAKKAMEARKKLKEENTKTDTMVKKLTPVDGKPVQVGVDYQDIDAIDVMYSDTVSALETQFNAGSISPSELVAGEADAWKVGIEAINTTRAFNKKVYDTKIETINLHWQPQYMTARENAGKFARSAGYVDPSASATHRAEGLTVTAWNNLSVDERNKRDSNFTAFRNQVGALIAESDRIMERWHEAQNAEKPKLDQFDKSVKETEDKFSVLREPVLSRWTTRSLESIKKIQPFLTEDAAIQKRINESILGKPANTAPGIPALIEQRSKAKEIWYKALMSFNERFKYEEINKFDPTPIASAIREYAKADEDIQRIVPQLTNQIIDVTEGICKDYDSLVENATSVIEKEKNWADLAFMEPIKTRIDFPNNINVPQLYKLLTADAVHQQILNNANGVPVTAQNWLTSANDVLAEKYDPEILRSWSNRVEAYKKAVQEVGKMHTSINTAYENLTRVIYGNQAIFIIDGDDRKAPADAYPLAVLSSKFSSVPAAEYVKPSIQTAAWLKRGIKITVKELNEKFEKKVPTDAIRINIGDYETAVEEANAKKSSIETALKGGQNALKSKDFPGFGNALGIPPSPQLPNTANFDESYRLHRQILRRISNIQKGLVDLPDAYAKVDTVQNDYIAAVRAFHTSLLKLYTDEYTKIETMLAKGQWKEAKAGMVAIQNKMPQYPGLPEGAIVEKTSIEDLGLTADYAKTTQRRQNIETKIKRLEEEEKNNPDGNDPNINTKINEFYQSFKAAYESRNEMKLLSYLSDNWTAGDGTDLGDITATLRNSFTMYDQVKFIIGPLNIQKIPTGFRVTYDVTITGKNLENDIKHEEKSTVTEDVNIDAKGKIKIQKTLTGRFWYVD